MAAKEHAFKRDLFVSYRLTNPPSSKCQIISQQGGSTIEITQKKQARRKQAKARCHNGG